jgi:hypothetical protein
MYFVEIPHQFPCKVYETDMSRIKDYVLSHACGDHLNSDATNDELIKAYTSDLQSYRILDTYDDLVELKEKYTGHNGLSLRSELRKFINDNFFED